LEFGYAEEEILGLAVTVVGPVHEAGVELQGIL
jgi:hypothetical protein